jgi:hypothetical protein
LFRNEESQTNIDIMTLFLRHLFYIVGYYLVPINSSLLTIILYCSVVPTLVYDDTFIKLRTSSTAYGNMARDKNRSLTLKTFQLLHKPVIYMNSNKLIRQQVSGNNILLLSWNFKEMCFYN